MKTTLGIPKWQGVSFFVAALSFRAHLGVAAHVLRDSDGKRRHRHVLETFRMGHVKTLVKKQNRRLGMQCPTLGMHLHPQKYAKRANCNHSLFVLVGCGWVGLHLLKQMTGTGRSSRARRTPSIGGL